MRNRIHLPTLMACLLVSYIAVAQPSVAPGQAALDVRQVLEGADARVGYSTGLDALFQQWPALAGIRGLATVTLLAQLEAGALQTTLVVQAEDAWYGPLPLGQLVWIHRFGAGNTPGDSQMVVVGRAGRLSLTLKHAVSLDPATGALSPLTGPCSGSGEVTNLDLGQLTLAWPVLALTGVAQATLKVQGVPKEADFSVQLSSPEVSFRSRLVGPLTLAWNHTKNLSSLTAVAGAADAPLFSFAGTIPMSIDWLEAQATWLDDQPMNVEFTATHWTPERVLPLWEAPGGAAFDLELSLRASGALDQLKAQGQVQGTFGVLAGTPAKLVARLDVDASKQSLELSWGDGLAEASVLAALPLVSMRRSSSPAASASLSGTLALAIPLEPLAPYLPSFLAQPSGVLNGDVALSGSVGSPLANGQLAIQGGVVTLVPMQRRLENLDVLLSLQGNSMVVDRFAGESAPGRLDVSGECSIVLTPSATPAKAPLYSNWSANGRWNVAFEKYPLVQEGIPVSLLDGGADLVLEATPKAASVKIALGRSYVQVTSEELPAAASLPSDDAIHSTDWLGRATWRSFDLDHTFTLDLSLPDGLLVEGEGIELHLGGQMVMTQRGPLVEVKGGLEVEPRGEISLFHNRFNIRGGLLTLAQGNLARPAAAPATGAQAIADAQRPPEASPLEVVMDLAARTAVGDTHVLVRVMGPSKRPQLLLQSVPNLPEYQILTLLIMGRVDAEDQRDGEVRKAAAALVEKFHNPGLKKQLFDQIGVDNLGLGFGAGVSQPIVTVGKQVTRELYLETVYRHNAPPDANRREGRVQYRIAPRWTVDTRFGDAAEGGFGLFWAFSFGGPPPPPAPGDEWGRVRPQPPVDSDGDGVFDPFDLCLNELEDPDRFADADGCPDVDNDLDLVPDGVDQDPLQAETHNGYLDEDGLPDIAPAQLQKLTAWLARFSFDANSNAVPQSGQQALEAAAALLDRFQGLYVEVSGHTDDTGTPDRNQEVSLQRARSARAYLIRSGVPGNRITVVGKGSSEPLDTAGSDESRAGNRRVEIRLYYP